MSLRKNEPLVWLIGAFSVTFLIQFSPLLSSPFAPGWDSYFYLVQAKSYIQEGSMHSSRVSVFYTLLIGISYLTEDYVLSYDILVALGAASIPAYLCWVGSRKSTHRFWLIVIITWCCISPFYLHFVNQFCKNTIGILFLIIVIQCLFSKQWAFALLFTILSIFTHKLTGVLALGAVGISFILNISSQKSLWLLLGSFLLAFTIPFLLPEVISWDDLLRQTDSLQWIPTWQPLHFSGEFGNQFSWFWHIELWTISILSLSIPVLLFKKANDRRMLILGILAFIFLFPFLAWEKDGFSFRLLLLTPFLLLSSLIVFKNVKLTPVILAFLLIANSGLGYFKYEQKRHNPNFDEYAFVCRKLSHGLPNDFDGLIVAHKGLAEFITFELDIDVMPWRADYEIPQANYLRLAYVPKSSLVIIPDSVGTEISMNYYLLKESDWQKMLLQMTREERAALTTWKNPQEIRPTFFKKYKSH